MKTRCDKLVRVSMFQHCLEMQSTRDTLVMQISGNCTLAGYFTVQRHCFWRGKHIRP